jgi:triosephosphate isomerase
VIPVNSVRRPLLVANWKMHKTVNESRAFAREWVRRAAEAGRSEPGPVELVVCPTMPALEAVLRMVEQIGVTVGAQNLDLGREGAVTGGVSAYLLAEIPVSYVIVGHSERRRDFLEDDPLVARKAAAALASGLAPIVCVGESHQEREGQATRAVVTRQIDAVLDALSTPDERLVVAYEPIWAIGTGAVPEPADANQVAGWIRGEIRARWGGAADRVRILYGGSVSPNNVESFWRQPEVDGALVGGSSLRLDQWLALQDRMPSAS